MILSSTPPRGALPSAQHYPGPIDQATRTAPGALPPSSSPHLACPHPASSHTTPCRKRQRLLCRRPARRRAERPPSRRSSQITAPVMLRKASGASRRWSAVASRLGLNAGSPPTKRASPNGYQHWTAQQTLASLPLVRRLLLRMVWPERAACALERVRNRARKISSGARWASPSAGRAVKRASEGPAV